MDLSLTTRRWRIHLSWKRATPRPTPRPTPAPSNIPFPTRINGLIPPRRATKVVR